MSYADLETASVVVLAGLEPEDEAATIFLRLRKASKDKTKIVALAPYVTRGLVKMNGRLIPTAPGAEADALRALADDGLTALDAGGVILVGERLAQSHGALTAAVELAKTTGARLAWVPRRAGDRGAVEAGCLPTLLPGGRPASDAVGSRRRRHRVGRRLAARQGRPRRRRASSPRWSRATSVAWSSAASTPTTPATRPPPAPPSRPPSSWSASSSD